jgi:hypothetical protein
MEGKAVASTRQKDRKFSELGALKSWSGCFVVCFFDIFFTLLNLEKIAQSSFHPDLDIAPSRGHTLSLSRPLFSLCMSWKNRQVLIVVLLILLLRL